MSKQISSVEFLEIQLIKNGIITNIDLKQAKEMHKQEIEDAFECGEMFTHWPLSMPDFDEYYKQTFEQ